MSDTTPTGGTTHHDHRRDTGGAGSGGELRPERLGGGAGARQAAGELRPERLGSPLRPERLGALAEELPGWRIDGGRLLERTFHWPDRAAAVAFATLAAATGDALAAAPEIHLAGTSVTVRLAGRGGGLVAGQVEAARALDGRWGGMSGA